MPAQKLPVALEVMTEKLIGDIHDERGRDGLRPKMLQPTAVENSTPRNLSAAVNTAYAKESDGTFATVIAAAKNGMATTAAKSTVLGDAE